MTRNEVREELERLSKTTSRTLTIRDAVSDTYTVDKLTLKNGTDICIWNEHMSVDNEQFHMRIELASIHEIHRLAYDTICLWLDNGTSLYIRQ